MTWVKICGITNLEDALVAVDAGADAVGFVFYEKSPRNVDTRKVREIVAKLPKEIEKVGVLVMTPEEEINGVPPEAGLTAFQIHKDLSGTILLDALQADGWLSVGNPRPHWGDRIFVSLPASLLTGDEGYRGFGWSKGAASRIGALFVDSGRGNMPGGTGETFDWNQLEHPVKCLSLNFNVVVAGGLTPDNVGEAMGILHPWGVDVSSGVEAKPGKKDPQKVRAFVKAVREADKANSRN